MKSFFEKEDFIFNTRVYQKIVYNNKEDILFKIEDIAEKATLIMRDYEEKLSFFKENSEISKVNRNAAKGFTKVSLDTFEILKNSTYYSKLNNGIFDITIAPLVEEWEINSNNPKVLSEKKVKELKTLVDYEDVILNENNLSVMLLRENQKIDLGGIAKGYAADKIVEYLKSQNIEKAIINLGGNVFVLGEKSKDTQFKVGIQDPNSEDGTSIANIGVTNQSVVTSGIYERYLEQDGVMYHHMLDPSTGYPFENNLSSVTIISDSSIVGDGLSTTTFGLGLEKGMKLIESLDNTDAIFITKDQKIYTTSNLKGKLNLKDSSFELID